MIACLTALIVIPLVSAAEPSSSTNSSTTVPSSLTATDSSAQTSTSSQEQTSTSSDDIRTVVVTGTREATDVSKTGTSVSVVSSKDIQQKQYHTVDEALGDVPGVNVISTGAPGQQADIFIRGASTAESSYLIDGRRLPTDFFSSPNLQMLSLANVDHVEVARGPMSSVSGGAAMGGVVNIISRDGRGQGEPKSEAFMEAGSFDTMREGISSWGSEGGFDYSTGTTRTDTDNERMNNQYRSIGNMTKLGYQITPDLYFDTHILYAQDDAGSPNDRFTNEPTGNLTRELWGVSPGVAWQTTDIWKQSIYYGRYQYRQVSSANALPIDQPNDRVQVNTDQLDYQSHVQIYDSWGLTGGISANWVDYYLKLDQDATDFSTFETVPAGSIPIQNTQTNTGYFLESQWEIVKGWNFITNGRFDHYSDFGDAFTYRVATSYEIPDVKTVVHANYGTGYAPPTPADIATFYSGNVALKPEKSKGYEFGVAQPFWDDKVSVFGTWFHNDFTNLITFAFDPATSAFIPENISRAETEGVETGFTFKPMKQVRATLSYTNLSALELPSDTQDFTSRLPRRPRHTINASVTYKPIDAVSLTLSETYVADRVDTDFHSDSGNQIVQMEDYLNMRFTASWQINEYVQVYGRLENLTNDQYEETFGYPALDQAAYGGVKVTF